MDPHTAPLRIPPVNMVALLFSLLPSGQGASPLQNSLKEKDTREGSDLFGSSDVSAALWASVRHTAIENPARIPRKGNTHVPCSGWKNKEAKDPG